MSEQTRIFKGSLGWILLSFIGFFVLPTMTLHYGITDSTSEEIYEAMGWTQFNLSWIRLVRYSLCQYFLIYFNIAGNTNKEKLNFLLL